MKHSRILLALALAHPLLTGQVSGGTVDDPGDPAIEAAARRHAVVESVARRLIEGYIYQDQGERLATLIRDRRDAGHYEEVGSDEALAEALTRDLQEQSHDRHLQVFPPRRVTATSDETARARSPRSFFRSVNYGFPKIEVLQDNVGYLELLAFMDTPEAVERADWPSACCGMSMR